MQRKDNREGKKDLFSKIPPEMAMEILSRLPIRATVSCKVVSKAWLDLVESYLRRVDAKPHVVVFNSTRFPKPFKIMEFTEENKGTGDVMMNFGLGFPMGQHHFLCSSVNGLIFLHSDRYRDLFICNPMTREMMRVPNRPSYPWESHSAYGTVNIGFGVSKKGGQYKVVRVIRTLCWEVGCQIYTLGTGSWRTCCFEGEGAGGGDAMAVPLKKSVAAFANGDLYWLEYGLDWRLRICCLDLETEEFNCIPPPPRLYGRGCRNLTTWGDHLCLCDNLDNAVLDIWLRKEELDGGWSWTKELSITKPHGLLRRGYEFLFLIKIFQDGTILVGEASGAQVYCYSDKAKAFAKYGRISESYCIWDTNAVVYTPNFLSLKIQTSLMLTEEEYITSF